jgi:hypothetical protein
MKLKNISIDILFKVFGVPIMFIGFIKDLVALKKTSKSLIVNNLKTYGLHIFSNVISKVEIDDLLKDFERLKKIKNINDNGQLTGRIYSPGVLSPKFEKYIHEISPHVKSFFNTEYIKIEISYYQESFPTNTLNDIPGGEFHVDDNKANLKYFIYLSDVSSKNGPFSCVPGSGNWNLKGSLLRGILWEFTKNRNFLYGWLINSEDIIHREKKIIGKAGTNFLVDTTGLHRAIPVDEGKRVVAVISFNRSYFNYGSIN